MELLNEWTNQNILDLKNKFKAIYLFFLKACKVKSKNKKHHLNNNYNENCLFNYKLNFLEFSSNS